MQVLPNGSCVYRLSVILGGTQVQVIGIPSDILHSYDDLVIKSHYTLLEKIFPLFHSPWNHPDLLMSNNPAQGFWYNPWHNLLALPDLSTQHT